MDTEVLEVLRRRFGHDALRPAQRPAVEAMLVGRDLLAVLPTGSGKSLCFQLPAVLLRGLTLVVSPLVSLMEDQVGTLTRRGIPAEALHSALGRCRRREVERRLAGGELRLLYVAPERLATAGFLDRLARNRVDRLVVDEAHCISEWGHDFRPAYRRIGRAARRLGRPPVAAFTATATPATRQDVERSLGLRRPVRVVGSVDRPNLRYGVGEVGSLVTAAGVAARETRNAGGAAILYAGTRRRTERLAAFLRRRGVRCGAYHAGLTAGEREGVQEAFLQGGLRVVCATTAFGMGVDHTSVRLVCHVGMPATLEGYVQEAGRGGRDGAPARCLLLPLAGDHRLQRTLAACSWPRPSSVRRAWGALVPGRAVPESELARRLGRRVSGPEREGAIRVLALQGLLSVRRDPGDGDERRLLRRPDHRLEALEPGLLRRGRRRARSRYRAVRRYVRSRRCRRAVIARYFGEAPPACAGCDRCRTSGNGPGSPSVSRAATDG